MVSAERKVKPDHLKNAGLKTGGSLSGADLVCDAFEANLLKSSLAVQGFEPRISGVY
jgi:hypothetical protein